MLKTALTVLAFVALVSGLSTRTVSNYITGADRARYNEVFSDGLKSNDLQSLYYSSLNLAGGDKAAICKKLPSLYAESKLNDFEKNFYLIGTSKKLACTEKLSVDLKDAFTRNYTSTQEVFYTFRAVKELGKALTPDNLAQIGRNLQLVLKKDDSLSSLASAFYVAAEIGKHGEFALKRIEGTLAQADEVDGKLLQFEGGLSITASIIISTFKLTNAMGKPLPLNADQATKFTAYFLSRRSVQMPKGIDLLLNALETLNKNSQIVPASISLADNGKLSPEKAILRVRVSDVFGKALTLTPSVTVLAKNKEVVSGKLAPTSDKTVFELDLTKNNLDGGHYNVKVDAGTYKQELAISVLQKAKVASLEIGVADLESSSAPKKLQVSYPNALKEVLNADSQQKIVLKLSLVDERTSNALTVHQVFVRLANKQSQEEIIFIAEQDSSKQYKFDMDVGARSADFGYKSGLYSVELIVGDSLLSNSFTWRLADIQLKFSGEAREDGHPTRKPLPEIVHKFREPEKRPPKFFSNLFTGLCLAPLLILFILWARLGINVSNFPCSLSAPAFHGGLGAIFALYLCFWMQLDMFQTLRYLLPLGLFTFLAGNRLLRTIAARRLEKSGSGKDDK